MRNQIQIQGFDDQNFDTTTAEKIFIIFFIKNCNFLVPRPSKRTSKLQGKPLALKREHLSLQNFKLLPFSPGFRIIFALLDPDPDTAAQN
jgi:hypothetical protein